MSRGGPRAAATLVFFLSGTLMGAWAARMPAIAGRLDLGPGQLGLALAGLALGSLVAMPLTGRWVARSGSRRAMRAMLAACCLATPLLALAPSLALLCVATIALGAATGSLDVAMNAQGTAIERRAGRMMLSSMHAAFSAGGLAVAMTGALAAGLALDVGVHLALVGAAAAVAGLFATGRLLAGEADATPDATGFARPHRGLWGLGAAADWSAAVQCGRCAPPERSPPWASGRACSPPARSPPSPPSPCSAPASPSSSRSSSGPRPPRAGSARPGPRSRP